MEQLILNKPVHALCGNGIDSDYEALQELLDSGRGLVSLPMPEKCYLIDRPLRIHSGTELRLPRFCVIRLADGSNCHMLEAAQEDGVLRDIRIEGGIWDYNNLGQEKNPIHFPSPLHAEYDGVCMVLQGIRNLTVCNLTVKDPTTYAVVLDTVSYFSVREITFDFNRGNPRPVNMDGIHLNGNCHYGDIRCLRGTCYDDMVALNADEGSNGPITHITIDGIYAEDCHSAVRLLTVNNEVSHIHITNVHGTFYQYCIGVTKYYDGESNGFFDALVFDNIHASKATRYAYLHINEETALHSYVYPLIFMEGGIYVKSLCIENVCRVERQVAASTVYLAPGATVETLTLHRICTDNTLPEPILSLDIRGTVLHPDYSGNTVRGNAE